jgi:hypothetical protein
VDFNDVPATPSRLIDPPAEGTVTVAGESLFPFASTSLTTAEDAPAALLIVGDASEAGEAAEAEGFFNRIILEICFFLFCFLLISIFLSFFLSFFLSYFSLS